MADEVIIVGITEGPIWGCPDAAYGAGQSLDATVDGEEGLLKSGNGNTIAAAYYDDKETVSYVVKIKGTVPTWTRGQGISIDGVSYILTGWKKGKKNTDFQEMTIDAKKFANITVTVTP